MKTNFFRSKPFFIILLYLGITIPLGLLSKPDLENVGSHPHHINEIFGLTIPMGGLNTTTIWVSWVAMAVIFLIFFSGSRNLKKVPGRMQLVVELIIGAFDKLCQDTMGPSGRKFMPMITTLFLFICFANWTGIVPFHLLPEPTADLNTPLAFGLISFLVSHICAIRVKGFGKYIWEYFHPAIPIGKFEVPNIFFFPLNVVGELGKLVSHSFRLFGNILGGVFIIQIVSALVRYIGLPVFLNIYFVLIVGLIQAFVFSILALCYTAILIEE